ncbi:MAG TPA: efflux RND transporter periplasmic adaptor subunit [Polyangia bacterium]|nr:efflux RND transporter periplasmic adaptor subunit [Polyangia bacterium]
MRPARRPRLLSQGLAVLALAASLPACRHRAAPEAAEQAPQDEVWLSRDQLERTDIRIVTAAETDVPQGIAASGRVAFNDLHVTHVFSPVTGRITRVLVQPGQRVKKGSPLLAIASPDVGQAFSDLVKAQADVAVTEADYHRQARLSAEGAATRRDAELAEDNFRSARAEYQRAEKRAALLRSGGFDAVTQEYTLKSFIEGEVIARMANPGVEVQGQYSGGTSAELFTVGDIKDVWVYADVADLDLARVELGADAEIHAVAYPGRVFLGKVDLVSSVVDPSLRTARVRIAVSNAGEELKPEMLAQVSIVLPPRHLLTVPKDAVVKINETTFAFVADGTRPDGRQIFRRRPVRTADAQGGLVPVLEGLAAGDRVVAEGSISREQPNDEVWPTPSQMEAAAIKVGPVAERDLANAVSVGGRLAFNDNRVSHVFSPVSGRVTKVLAEPGQRVSAGTPLLAIASPDVGGFVADVLKAEAGLVAAEHEYQRQKELYSYAAPVHAGTLRDLEAAEDAWKKAKAELDRARQKARLLRAGTVDAVTQEYVLRSPIAGEVIARMATPGLEIQGQYAMGGNVVELYTVGATDQLWVIGDVYEMDRPRINEGDAVTLTVGAFPEVTFHGTVDWVADVLDPTLHTAKVRCVIDNPQRLLKPDMYEALKISVPGRHLLAMPRGSLLRVGNDTIAFVEAGRRPDGAFVFKRRKVVANEALEGDLVPVLSGLAAGDLVAVDHAVLLLGML